jgi:hypothetical protein
VNLQVSVGLAADEKKPVGLVGGASKTQILLCQPGVKLWRGDDL